jgi:hypothetical protein
MKMISYRFFVESILLAVLTLLNTQCQTPSPSSAQGIEAGFEAYIPARIAIAPCALWPTPATQRQVEKLSAFSTQELCTRFDSFVAAGFEQQPYMSGLAPQLVQELAVAKRQAQWQHEAMAIWQKSLARCSEEGSAAADLYQRCVAASPEWEIWLAAFGRTIQHSDALLLPLIVEVAEQHGDDRGILLSSRRLKLVQLLIATDSAKLIWSRYGEASALNKRPVPIKERSQEVSDADYPAYPDWPLLHQRIFTPNFWKDFPGRLTLPGE